jgi:MFS transporter, AAHS family, 4-hydroxybenzoate transporter
MICSGHAPITRERRVAAAHREEIEKHARVEGRRLAAHAFSVQRCHYAAAAGYDELAAAALASISAIAPPEDSCGCLKPSNTSTAANSPPPMSQVRRRTKKSVIELHGKYRLVRTFTRAHVWMLGGSGAAPQAYRLKNPRPVSRFQLFVAAMCAAVIFMDGFDAQVMGYVAPALIVQLHITRAAFGPVVSIGLVGMMIGGLVGGPLADRCGRKPVLVGCCCAFGLLSLLTATAHSLESLATFRLLTGLGLGGAMPNSIAITSEYMPKRLRATAITTMFLGMPLGGALGGFVAAAVIPQFGWQAVFVVGGVLPLFVGAWVLAALPESIRFLILKGDARDRVARLLSRIAPDGAPHGELSIGSGDHRPGGFIVKQLFAEGRGNITVLLWIMFFMNLLALFFLLSWLPTLMHDNGISVQAAILVTTMAQIGNAVGGIVLGRLIDWRSSFRILGWTYLAAAVSIVFIGEAGGSLQLLLPMVFAAGFCTGGGQTAANALAAEFYPTAMRSTGVGWALGIGRIGSIIGPTLGGLLLVGGVETRRIFWMAAIPVLMGTVAAFMIAIAQERQRRGLEPDPVIS